MIVFTELQMNTSFKSLLQYFFKWEFVGNSVKNCQQVSVESDQKKLEMNLAARLEQ